MTEISPKPVRLIDVAQRAGVSRIVAGQVLLGSGGKSTRVSGATAQRVREAAAALDYRPNLIARQLSGVRTRTLAALIGADRYQVHYDRLRAIEREAERRGYRLMVGYVHGPDAGQSAAELFNEFEGRGVEGFVLLHRLRSLPPRVVERMTAARLVACQTQPALPEVCCIDLDIEAGMGLLVDHLVERGRRRMALLLPGDDQSRRGGFQSALRRHRLSSSAAVWASKTNTDSYGIDQIRHHIESELDAHFQPGRFDAILATNDLWGVQLIKALAVRGVRVPQDVAVTGIDNVDIAAACIPELTTLDLRSDAIAETVMDTVTHMIEGTRPAGGERHIVLEPRLIIRQST